MDSGRRYNPSDTARRVRFQFHWMDSLSQTSQPLNVTLIAFQFHWMDSEVLFHGMRIRATPTLSIPLNGFSQDPLSCPLTCQSSLSIPLNGFIRHPKSMVHMGKMEDTFNSIEWIHTKMVHRHAGFEFSFQFHWMDSLWIWGLLWGLLVLLFQFHWMDSRRASVVGCTSPP